MPETGTIGYGTLASSHLSVALFCIAARAPVQTEACPEVAAFVQDGRRRPQTVGRDPEFRVALDAGIPYTVIDWRVRLACPRALEIISKAGNAAQNVASGAQEHAILLDIISAVGRSGGRANIRDIGQEAFSTSPARMDNKPALMAFAARCAGASGMYIKDLAKCHARLNS